VSNCDGGEKKKPSAASLSRTAGQGGRSRFFGWKGGSLNGFGKEGGVLQESQGQKIAEGRSKGRSQIFNNCLRKTKKLERSAQNGSEQKGKTLSNFGGNSLEVENRKESASVGKGEKVLSYGRERRKAFRRGRSLFIG